MLLFVFGNPVGVGDGIQGAITAEVIVGSEHDLPARRGMSMAAGLEVVR